MNDPAAPGYEILLFHAGDDQSRERADGLKKALRDEAAALRLPRALLHIRDNPATDAEPITSPPLRLGLFLARDNKSAGDELCSLIDAWLAQGVLVIPLLGADVRFDRVVPASLSCINAIVLGDWNQPARSVVLDVLRQAGIAELERRVFISYKRDDSGDIAEALWERLEQRGFQVFLDRFSIDRGEHFQQRLEERLSENAMLLLLESPRVNQSHWVQQEVIQALSERLGLLAITWPEVVDNPALRVDAIPGGYRHPLKRADFRTASELQPAALQAIVDQAERVHAQAMARRRRDLLGSLLQALSERLPTVQPQWFDRWRLRIDTGARRFQVDAVPRPVTAWDLFHCDPARGAGYDEGRLLHYHHRRSQPHRALLNWLTQGRALRCYTDSEIDRLMDELEQARP